MLRVHLGDQDLIIVAFNDANREYTISARAAASEPWSTFEGGEDEIDTLLSLARDVMTGG